MALAEVNLRVNYVLYVRCMKPPGSVPGVGEWLLLKDRALAAPRLCSCTDVNGREKAAAPVPLPPICAASKAEKVDKKWKLPSGSEVTNKR